MSWLKRTIDPLATSFRIGFANALAYPTQLLVGILATNMSLVMLAFWSAVAKEGRVGRFGQTEFTGYFLTSAIVRMLTSSYLIWEMNEEIRQGTLATRLLRPFHPFASWATHNLASLPLRALVALPLGAALVGLVGRSHLASDPWLWLITPLAVTGAWLLTFSVMLFVGALCLYWESSAAIWELWFGLFVVFSGYLLPLELLPAWLSGIVRVTPFPYVLSFPVETILGMSRRAQAFRDLGTQWAYIAVFLTGALVLWRRGLVRFEAYGG